MKNYITYSQKVRGKVLAYRPFYIKPVYVVLKTHYITKELYRVRSFDDIEQAKLYVDMSHDPKAFRVVRILKKLKPVEKKRSDLTKPSPLLSFCRSLFKDVDRGETSYGNN